MNKLRKCSICKKYTLNKIHCNQETKETSYKFLKIKTTFPVSQQA